MAKPPFLLLSESIAQSLEHGNKGSKFPTLQAYLQDNKIKDLPLEKVMDLLKEIRQVYDSFLAGRLVLAEPTVEVLVPVHDTGYNPALGVPVEKDAKEVLGHLLNQGLDQCSIAIMAQCGFGKFSVSPGMIGMIVMQLCTKRVEFSAPLSSGARLVQIVGIDSNNSSGEGRCLVDGLHNRFQVTGLIAVDGKIRAFVAGMDYGTRNWNIERADEETMKQCVSDFQEFILGYEALMEKPFHYEDVQQIDEDIFSQLQATPHFKLALNRICNRWLM